MNKNILEIWPDNNKNDTKNSWENRREEIIHILCEEEYGFLPAAPVKLEWKITNNDYEFCAGKAPLRSALLNFTLQNGNTFSLPVKVMLPTGKKNIPFFVYISFYPETPDRFLPCEEIIDNGFGILSFYYEDVTKDNNDFNSGLAGKLKLTDNTSCGKIALWAWAAMRVMDYAAALPELDKTRAAIAGHSRLGKTALLAGAVDTRFSHVISNNSGCCGAAISRGKKGERICNITDVFPFWFRDKFKQYADNEDSLPFDQHFLLAASAPRNVYISSAASDSWADPENEFLGCKLAGKVWEKLGFKGFVCDDDAPVIGKLYHDDKIAYHVRNGSHYLSREEWQNYIRFIK